MTGGPVARYEIFVSRGPIAVGHLGRARRIAGPQPAPPRTMQSARIGGAARFVAIRSIDASGNISALTQVAVPPPR